MGSWGAALCLIWSSFQATRRSDQKAQHKSPALCGREGLTRKEMMEMMMMMMTIKETQWHCWPRTRKQTWVSANPPPRWTGTSQTVLIFLDTPLKKCGAPRSARGGFDWLRSSLAAGSTCQTGWQLRGEREYCMHDKSSFKQKTPPVKFIPFVHIILAPLILKA